MRKDRFQTTVGAAFVLALGGCNTTIVSDTHLTTSKATPIQFGGTNTVNPSTNHLYAYNTVTSAWDEFGVPIVGPSGSPNTDVSGNQWYPWAGDRQLPQAPQYWSQSLTSRELKIDVKTSFDFGTGRLDNVVYDYAYMNPGHCVGDNYQTQDGYWLMANCKSAKSPVATIYVPCGANGQDCCLGGGACDSGNYCSIGTCVLCKNLGSMCSSSTECCGTAGATCQAGICKLPCTAGLTCTVSSPPGLKGPCALGKTVCDSLGHSSCSQTVFPTTETCNGVDDNCDGAADNGIPSVPCANGKPSVTCQSGFSVPGMTSCVNGAEKCLARACNPNNANDTDCYCTSCGGASGGYGKPCGECAQTNCVPGVTACQPSSVCSSASGGSPPPSLCQPDYMTCLSFPSCWTPADVKLPPNHCYAGP